MTTPPLPYPSSAQPSVLSSQPLLRDRSPYLSPCRKGRVHTAMHLAATVAVAVVLAVERLGLVLGVVISSSKNDDAVRSNERKIAAAGWQRARGEARRKKRNSSSSSQLRVPFNPIS